MVKMESKELIVETEDRQKAEDLIKVKNGANQSGVKKKVAT